MACTELDSFLSKFKHLQFAGIEATLTVESKNGEAFVTLKAGLGHLQPPVGFPPPHGYGVPRRVHRGPAYFRRQERRKAAQVEAADHDDTISLAGQVCDDDISDETPIQNDKSFAEKATDEVLKKQKKMLKKLMKKTLSAVFATLSAIGNMG